MWALERHFGAAFWQMCVSQFTARAAFQCLVVKQPHKQVFMCLCVFVVLPNFANLTDLDGNKCSDKPKRNLGRACWNHLSAQLWINAVFAGHELQEPFPPALQSWNVSAESTEHPAQLGRAAPCPPHPKAWVGLSKLSFPGEQEEPRTTPTTNCAGK